MAPVSSAKRAASKGDLPISRHHGINSSATLLQIKMCTENHWNSWTLYRRELFYFIVRGLPSLPRIVCLSQWVLLVQFSFHPHPPMRSPSASVGFAQAAFADRVYGNPRIAQKIRHSPALQRAVLRLGSEARSARSARSARCEPRPRRSGWNRSCRETRWSEAEVKAGEELSSSFLLGGGCRSDHPHLAKRRAVQG